MDKIIIQNLTVKGILGIHDWEREKPRLIVLNITVFTARRKESDIDSIDACVDYSKLAEKIRTHARKAASFTVEALASDLAKICLEDPKILKTIVRVDKPGAIQNAETVGVQIERLQKKQKQSIKSKKKNN